MPGYLFDQQQQHPYLLEGGGAEVDGGDVQLQRMADAVHLIPMLAGEEEEEAGEGKGYHGTSKTNVMGTNMTETSRWTENRSGSSSSSTSQDLLWGVGTQREGSPSADKTTTSEAKAASTDRVPGPLPSVADHVSSSSLFTGRILPLRPQQQEQPHDDVPEDPFYSAADCMKTLQQANVLTRRLEATIIPAEVTALNRALLQHLSDANLAVASDVGASNLHGNAPNILSLKRMFACAAPEGDDHRDPGVNPDSISSRNKRQRRSSQQDDHVLQAFNLHQMKLHEQAKRTKRLAILFNHLKVTQQHLWNELAWRQEQEQVESNLKQGK